VIKLCTKFDQKRTIRGEGIDDCTFSPALLQALTPRHSNVCCRSDVTWSNYRVGQKV